MKVRSKRRKWSFTRLSSVTGFLLISTLQMILIASTGQAKTESLVLDAGPLQIEVHISRTAHLFHVVDQLSEWSEFCHDQYRDGIDPLSDADLAILAKHATVREERSWGQGLEQTFYTKLPLEEAIERGIQNGWLTEEQAEIEREVFIHFAGRIDDLIEMERENLLRFQRHLQEQLPHLRTLSVKLSRFYLGAAPRIPAYLLANPHDRNHGGGKNR